MKRLYFIVILLISTFLYADDAPLVDFEKESVPIRNEELRKIKDDIADLTSSVVVQVVNVMDGAVDTGTTAMPQDDTIPQITEGDEYMTLAITPTSTTNELLIEVVIHLASSSAVSNNISVALFQDATANALASCMKRINGANGMVTMSFNYYMTAGTTSSTTFRVRAGDNAGGTITFNGASGSRIHGGVMASSITITEIIP